MSGLVYSKLIVPIHEVLVLLLGIQGCIACIPTCCIAFEIVIKHFSNKNAKSHTTGNICISLENWVNFFFRVLNRGKVCDRARDRDMETRKFCL